MQPSQPISLLLGLISKRCYHNSSNVNLCFYHFRDLTEGTIFYIISPTSVTTRQLFRMQNIIWIGTIVGLFEPDFHSFIKNTPVISMEQPLLPLRDNNIQQQQQLRPYIEEYANKIIPRVLYVRDADLTLTKVNVIAGCNSSMCDAQHDESSPCPALTAEDIKCRIISCRVTSRVANINNVPFRSKTLTQFFLTANAMKVSPLIYLLIIWPTAVDFQSTLYHYRSSVHRTSPLTIHTGGVFFFFFANFTCNNSSIMSVPSACSDHRS